jgi:hypothetical protein
MAIWLKEDTATTIVIGPFVDETDGKTAETALTISQADVLVWKQGGTSFNAKNEGTAATHRSNGIYTVPLDATDTSTPGQLIVSVHESGALPVRHDFMVVPAHVYDGLMAASGTDYLQVDVRQVNSTSEAAVQLARNALRSLTGTVDTSTFTSTTTQFEAADITEATADHYKGRVVLFSSGAMDQQGAAITAYSLSGGKGKFTVDALTEAPANGVTFQII